VQDLENLTDEQKIDLFNIIHHVALADNICVPREALLLLAIQYSLGIESDPRLSGRWTINPAPDVQLVSCPTGENTISTQYVIYIEGQYNDAINQDIQSHLEVSVLKLREWGFDFIYIPALIHEFRSMNAEYVQNVIRYMAPELPEDTILTVYNRLLRMDTLSFCNHVLAENLHVDSVKNTSPALFINIGTSFVPYCSVSGPVECYTEFLCIPLTSDISSQIDRFLEDYSKLVSFTQTDSRSLASKRNCFKYFGFYKAMFDFLVKAEPKESDIILHPWNTQFEFPGASVPDLNLSPQEAAIYKLILECTYNHSWGGLPRFFSKNQAEVERLYRIIYHNKTAKLPDPESLASIHSRIKSKIRQQLNGLSNLEDYVPKNKDGYYFISAQPSRIKISASRGSAAQDFIGHQWK
jgi:hypothetical protein